MLRTIVFVECMVCMTWDDDLRTKLLYCRLHLIMNRLRHFNDFLSLTLSSGPIKLNGLLKIYLFSLVI